MNQSIMVMFNGAKLCPKGQAFIDGLTPGAGPIDAYNRAPNGAWIVWGCSKRPMTPERVRRLVLAAALYVRAALPLVPEKCRALVERCAGYAEFVGRGEAIDNDAAWADVVAAALRVWALAEAYSGR